MDCFSWVPELQQPSKDYELNHFPNGTLSNFQLDFPRIQHNKLTKQIVALLCACVFLDIDLCQKEDRYAISTHQKPWSSTQHVAEVDAREA